MHIYVSTSYLWNLSFFHMHRSLLVQAITICHLVTITTSTGPPASSLSALKSSLCVLSTTPVILYHLLNKAVTWLPLG